jgi:hypothetical protein
MLPLIVVDIIAFAFVEWGYQLLITSIESLLICLLILGFTIYEFRTLQKTVMEGKSDEDGGEYFRITPKMFDQHQVSSLVPDSSACAP